MAADQSNAGVNPTGKLVDPTKNVLDLVYASNARQDDLRVLTKELFDAKLAAQAEAATLRATHEATISRLREEYQEKVARAESGRLDSIRQVDREEVAKTAVAANTAITTLAKQTTDLSTTLAKQVADTAAAAEARNSAQYSDTNKRLSALELSSSEGKGKQTVADPMLEKMMLRMEALIESRAQVTGRDAGLALSWGAVTGVLGLILSLAAVGALVSGLGRPAAVTPPPQIIYSPSPAGTLLPSTPPTTAPLR